MVPGVMLYIQYWWSDGTGTNHKMETGNSSFYITRSFEYLSRSGKQVVNYSASVTSHDAKV
jgi:hypothetical protein